MNEFPTHEELQELAPAYVLDAVSSDEAEQFRVHTAGCVECQELVRDLRETLADVGSTYEVAAPQGAEERLMRAVAALPRQPQVDSNVVDLSERRTRRAQSWWLVAAVAVVVVVLGSFALVGLRQVERLSNAQQVMAVATARDAHLMPAPMPSASPSFVVSMSMNKAAIMATSMPMPASGHVYEVWAKTMSGSMVSAGMFTPSSSGHVAQLLNVNLHNTKALMLTVEPKGGSAQPTQPAFAEVTL